MLIRGCCPEITMLSKAARALGLICSIRARFCSLPGPLAPCRLIWDQRLYGGQGHHCGSEMPLLGFHILSLPAWHSGHTCSLPPRHHSVVPHTSKPSRVCVARSVADRQTLSPNKQGVPALAPRPRLGAVLVGLAAALRWLPAALLKCTPMSQPVSGRCQVLRPGM